MSTSRKVYYGTDGGLKVKIQINIYFIPECFGLKKEGITKRIKLNFNEED